MNSTDVSNSVNALTQIVLHQHDVVVKRIQSRQEKARKEAIKRQEEVKKNEQQLIEAVFHTIFKFFNPEGFEWTDKVQDYDPDKGENIPIEISQIFRENFGWNWSIDPRQDLTRFLDEINVELRTHPVVSNIRTHKDWMTQHNYDLESVVLRIKRR